MNEIKSEKKRFNPLTFFKKRINPEFTEFIFQSISEIKVLLNTFLDKIESDNHKKIYVPKINEILKELSLIKEKFELYSKKFKYYTEETERSLRKFAFLTKELISNLNFTLDAYENEKNEIYLLNLVNFWTQYSADVKNLFYNIENYDYPYTIHTIFSLAFVLVPFLNIFSLVGGIFLMMRKDWRAISFGTITLILYFIQFINIMNLAAIG
ncbi:MAG: hypothetical protein ACTSQP_16010 [Promethearchaeota archaeon]